MGKIFFIGDSIVAGCWDENNGWASKISQEIIQMTMASMKNKEKFFCMPYNLGVPGNTVPDIINRFKHEISVRLNQGSTTEAVQIVFAIGINDSIYLVDKNKTRFSEKEFKDNIVKLIDVSKTITNNISFIGLTPVNDSLLNPIPWTPELAYKKTLVKLFESLTQEVCKERNIAFLPIFDICNNLSNFNDYLFDGVHPNSEGHNFLTNKVRDFIINDEFIKIHS